MTFEERVWALDPFGLTPRQARFVVTVALHSGYCLRRQYSTFTGLAYGSHVRDFLDGLVTRGLAQRFSYRADRGHVYHLHARSLYRALRQTDNRNRRYASPALIARKLMLLDFVISEPDAQWYATEDDKVALFTRRFQVPLADLPQRAYQATSESGRDTTRYFVHKLPIYLRGDPPVVHVVYLALDPAAGTFDQFLRDHARLLAHLPAWAVVAVAPGQGASLPACEALFNWQVSSTDARARNDVPAALRWYFTTRRAVEQDDFSRLSVADIQRYRSLRRDFAAPNFESLYANWVLRGDAVFADDPERAIAVAARHGKGQLLTHVLPHRYEQFGSFPGVS